MTKNIIYPWRSLFGKNVQADRKTIAKTLEV